MRQWRFHWAVRQFDGAATFALFFTVGMLILCLIGTVYDLGLGLRDDQLPTALFGVVLALIFKIVSKALRQLGRYIGEDRPPSK